MSYYFKGKRIGNCIDMVGLLTGPEIRTFEKICEENNIDVWTRDGGHDWNLDPLYDWLIGTFEEDPGYARYGIKYVEDGLDNRKPKSESYHEMVKVRNAWAKQRYLDPKIVELSKKQDVKDFAGDYWAYVKMTEHGNEPSLEELAEYHGQYVAEITGKTDDDYMYEYIKHEESIEDLSDEERGLMSRLRSLQSKYRNYNRKPKGQSRPAGVVCPNCGNTLTVATSEFTKGSVYHAIFDCPCGAMIVTNTPLEELPELNIHHYRVTTHKERFNDRPVQQRTFTTLKDGWFNENVSFGKLEKDVPGIEKMKIGERAYGLVPGTTQRFSVVRVSNVRPKLKQILGRKL